jgi:hypothetical protein
LRTALSISHLQFTPLLIAAGRTGDGMTMISDNPTFQVTGYDDLLRRNDQQPLRAMNVDEFCLRYACGRTKFYVERKAGRIKVPRNGKHLITAVDDPEERLASLPAA